MSCIAFEFGCREHGLKPPRCSEKRRDDSAYSCKRFPSFKFFHTKKMCKKYSSLLVHVEHVTNLVEIISD